MSKRALVVLSVLAVHFAPAQAAERTIIVLGDSLSSGYGLGAEQSWVGLLENHLAGQAYGYEVVNASIAGDTSAGALARLPGLLATHRPAIVVIELGGNDGLRGQPVQRLKENLARIIELTQAAHAKIVLTGIQIPPNYGPAYTEAFASVYHELATEYDVALVGFLMDGIALDPSLMQEDRIHPNAAGQRPMFENVWNVLSELL
ncbi:MAG TPA: arylesterase [Gammaproteobacteria bacterium]|jgi:acyl-CoA thioesterase-1